MSIPLENLRRDMRKRLETDRQMSGAWAVVPLIPLIVGILALVFLVALALTPTTVPPSGTSTAAAAAILGVLFLVSIIYLVIFIVLVLVGVLIYFLVRRRNNHFNRQILFEEDLVSMTRELAAKKGIDISVPLNNMDRSVREARLEETEKNATLYAILGGVAWIYVSYFLMKDFFKHERREDLFINDTLRAFNVLGIPVNLPYRNPPIPDRSFALYFILTLILGGIFGVYWVYVLVSDPNNHFRQHMMIEDTIMAQLSGTLPSSPVPSASPG